MPPTTCRIWLRGGARPGVMAAIAGTSTAMLVSTPRPVLDPARRFLLTPHTLPDLWGLEMDLMATGSAVRWLATSPLLWPPMPSATRPRSAETTAQLARELLETDLIKLEVIGDAQTLYPDTRETIAAYERAHLGVLTASPLEVQKHKTRLTEEFGVTNIAELVDLPDKAPASVGAVVTNLRLRW